MMKVCFAYVTDKNGFDLACLSAVSVALSQPSPCHIHFFCHKFTGQPGKALSEALARRGGQVSFSQIGNATVEQHQTHGHVTTPTLLKLSAVSALVANFDRIVYLDNDVLLFDDLKIGRLDFGSYPIAAVTDMDLSPTGVLRNSRWLGASSRGWDTGNYFNAGVMIFESSNWRRGFLQTYAAALDRHDQGCSYKLDCTSIDQCALNTTFDNNWLKLPGTYNMQAGAKFTESWRTASARHYCGPRKCVPLQPFRSDGRDVRAVNTIHRELGLPRSRWGLLHAALFLVNRVRHFRGDVPMRNFLAAHAAAFGPASVSSRSRADPARVPLRA